MKQFYTTISLLLGSYFAQTQSSASHKSPIYPPGIYPIYALDTANDTYA